ncbi:MAG: nucleotide sugar dehydrogenase [bacterium JZ-2024 1]
MAGWKEMEKLLEKIKRKDALVAVIGVGYVGLPLLVEIAKAGFPVRAVDVNEEKLEKIRKGVSYIPDVPDETLRKLVQEGKIDIFSYEDLSRADILISCVPTPLTSAREPDISPITDSTRNIAKTLRKGQLIVLESTTFPGTTEEIVLGILNQERGKEGWQAGKDFFLGYSPERVDPGNRRYTIATTPKIVSGVTPNCLQLVKSFYLQFVKEVVPVSSPKVAETAKLLENTYRAVNIGLVNELALLCHRMGIDVWEVIQAASTKPFGFQPFYPGPGIGGHCIPFAPLYLAYRAKEFRYQPRFLELAEKVNQMMPDFIVERTLQYLSDMGIPPENSRILLLGVTYKADVADIRQSPAVAISLLLKEKGVTVDFHDPYVEKFSSGEGTLTRKWGSQPDYEQLDQYDLVLIVTAHSLYDREKIVQYARKIFDLRNAIPFYADNVWKL